MRGYVPISSDRLESPWAPVVFLSFGVCTRGFNVPITFLINT